MEKSKLILILFLVVQAGFSQQHPREILNGQIVADSLSVENVNITNITTNKYTVSDNLGHFNIYAREKDTLVFTSFGFDSKKLVLTASDLKVKLFRVKLDVFVNALDEVVISPHALTGDLEVDEKNIKVTQLTPINVGKALEGQYERDSQSSVQNTVMPGYVNTQYMMDFNKIGKKLLKLIKGKEKPKPIVYTSDKIFPEAVKQNVPDSFFRETLKLDKNEVGLFLSFCENDDKAQSLLNPRKKFELIDFLIEKHKEYQEYKKKE